MLRRQVVSPQAPPRKMAFRTFFRLLQLALSAAVSSWPMDTRRWRNLKWVVAIPFLPVLLAYVVIWLLCSLIWIVCLHLLIWIWWCPRGRDVLFVYSDSPVWHDYVETQILPRLGDRAVVMNWSQRQHWRGVSLARLAFYHFGGDRQFNPLAVVFRPFRRTRKFRFYQPFRDFKHGRPETLHKMEGEFFGLIG